MICPNCTDCATKSGEARDKATPAEQAQLVEEWAGIETKAQDRIAKETGAVYVEGGTFEMGSNQGDADAGTEEMVQGKKHSVKVGSFYMAKTEVTQSQWRAVMGINPPALYNTNCDNCPVEGVSYKDVEAFLTKLNSQQSTHRYRLPTEAEWEYAARGGANWTDGYVYAGSNDIGDVAWYDGNYKDSMHGSRGSTHPVGTKAPNQLGLYDLSGNVFEWCADWYKGYRGSSSVPNYIHARVFRGGSWLFGSHFIRVADRSFGAHTYRNEHVGFRLVFSQ